MIFKNLVFSYHHNFCLPSPIIPLENILLQRLLNWLFHVYIIVPMQILLRLSTVVCRCMFTFCLSLKLMMSFFFLSVCLSLSLFLILSHLTMASWCCFSTSSIHISNIHAAFWFSWKCHPQTPLSGLLHSLLLGIPWAGFFISWILSVCLVGLLVLVEHVIRWCSSRRHGGGIVSVCL